MNIAESVPGYTASSLLVYLDGFQVLTLQITAVCMRADCSISTTGQDELAKGGASHAIRIDIPTAPRSRVRSLHGPGAGADLPDLILNAIYA